MSRELLICEPIFISFLFLFFKKCSRNSGRKGIIMVQLVFLFLFFWLRLCGNSSAGRAGVGGMSSPVRHEKLLSLALSRADEALGNGSPDRVHLDGVETVSSCQGHRLVCSRAYPLLRGRSAGITKFERAPRQVRLSCPLSVSRTTSVLLWYVQSGVLFRKVQVLHFGNA